MERKNMKRVARYSVAVALFLGPWACSGDALNRPSGDGRVNGASEKSASDRAPTYLGGQSSGGENSATNQNGTASDPSSVPTNAAEPASQEGGADPSSDGNGAAASGDEVDDDDDVTDRPSAAAPLPDASPGDPAFTGPHFAGSDNCTMCHDGLTDSDGRDVSIVQAWAPTMMANSTRDPLWQAKVRSELRRAPAAAALLNDKCTRCHAPMANEQAHKSGGAFGIFGDGLLRSGHALNDPAMDGVSCTLCHQIAGPDNLGSADATSGQFTIGDDGALFGPYQDLFPQPMINQTGYTPTYSAHVQSSALCATCHDLRTPVVDGNGDVIADAGFFPEQMPYTEWLASDFVNQQTCQDCHMGRAQGVVMASRPPWLDNARDNFALHGFAGANQLMLEILRDNPAELGVQARNFAPILRRTREILSKSAGLDLQASRSADGELLVEVQVRNLGGHKLPTSFPSRRVVVGLIVEDGNGATLFASGVIGDDGRIPIVDERRTYEPHHDEITAQDQAQIYETIMGTTDDAPTWGLLRASHYLKDNRILPKGAVKESLPADIRVAGAAREDENFTGGSDQIRYRMTGVPASPLRIIAKLQYQTLSPGFADDLFEDRDQPEVARFERLYERAPSKTVILISAELPLP